MQELHNEADTRAKLIHPALHKRGWSEDKIKREETPGAVDVVDGKPRKRAQGRIDYTLRVRVNGEATRRYYQDAAIRATFEKLAQCEKRGEAKRVLLSLVTGAGKTFIAVHLLKCPGPDRTACSFLIKIKERIFAL